MSQESELRADKKYKRDMDILRSVALVDAIRKSPDKEARQRVEEFDEELEFDANIRHDLMIEEETWLYVKRRGYKPSLVFCHPTILAKSPITSLYYRGMSGLSRKAVGYLAASVDKAETDPDYKFRNPASITKIAQLYNFFISSIIAASEDWALENGYRTILATMGITFDGTSRNKVGAIAEERIRKVLLEFVIENDLSLDAQMDDLDKDRKGFPLHNDLTMWFSSEPDVYFLDANSVVVGTIEVKGGLDSAGALERLGAAQKSFGHAIKRAANCKTYLVAGAITKTMEKRLLGDRNFTKHFAMIDILTDASARALFLREVFHYGLRLID